MGSSARRTGGPLIRPSGQATLPVVSRDGPRRPTPALERSRRLPGGLRDRRRAGRRRHRLSCDRSGPTTAPRLTAFHERQSPESIYFRYFSPRPRLTERDLERLTHVDYTDRFALVALRGDELIGVARYDRWRHRAEAEVAFFVDDANHGRGLATRAARAPRGAGAGGGAPRVHRVGAPRQPAHDRGVHPGGVRDGHPLRRRGVEVRLDLQPTPEAEAAIEARARTAAAEAVRRLLSPRSVAVIGAGRDPDSLGHRVLRQLQLARFAGPVWPVNPNAHDVASMRAVRSILDIDEEVDLAIIVVPGRRGRRRRGGVRSQAGVRRRDPVGRASPSRAPRARRWRPRCCARPARGASGWSDRTASGSSTPTTTCGSTPPSSTSPPAPGGCRCCPSPGMLGAVLVTTAHEAGLGLSSFLALGNRADVSGNDLLQYWEADDTTDVVGMYIESFGNPRNFSRLARRLTRAKPVVAVKAGRLADADGSDGDATEDALLRQTGVVRVPTLDALVDTARLLLTQPLPAGRRVAVLGNAGGSLAIAADAVLTAELELADLAPSTLAEVAAPPTPDTVAGHRRPRSARRRPRRGAGHGGARRRSRASTRCSSSTPRGSGPPPTRRSRRSRVGRKARPEVPVVVCAYGPQPHPVGRGARCTTRSTRPRTRSAAWRPTPRGDAEPEGEPLALDDEPRGGRAPARAGAARARAEPSSATSRRSRCSTPIGLAGAAHRGGRRRGRGAGGRRVDGLPGRAQGGRPRADRQDRRRRVRHRPRGPRRAARSRGSGWPTGSATTSRRCSCSRWSRPASTWPCAVRDHPTVGPVLSIGLGRGGRRPRPPTDVRVLPLTDLDAAPAGRGLPPGARRSTTPTGRRWKRRCCGWRR